MEKCPLSQVTAKPAKGLENTITVNTLDQLEVLSNYYASSNCSCQKEKLDLVEKAIEYSDALNVRYDNTFEQLVIVTSTPENFETVELEELLRALLSQSSFLKNKITNDFMRNPFTIEDKEFLDESLVYFNQLNKIYNALSQTCTPLFETSEDARNRFKSEASGIGVRKVIMVNGINLDDILNG